MDLLSTLIYSLPDPWGAIVIATMALLGAIVTFASVIVPFTKTKTDDRIVSKLKSVLDRFSLLKPKK